MDEETTGHRKDPGTAISYQTVATVLLLGNVQLVFLSLSWVPRYSGVCDYGYFYCATLVDTSEIDNVLLLVYNIIIVSFCSVVPEKQGLCLPGLRLF